MTFEKECPECGSSNIIESEELEGLFICEDCGCEGTEDDFLN